MRPLTTVIAWLFTALLVSVALVYVALLGLMMALLWGLV